MKNVILPLMFSFFAQIIQLQTAFAEGDAAPTWLLFWIKATSEQSWSQRIRTWNIHLDDIPNVIHAMIKIFLEVAGTVAVLFVIVWAYQLLSWSLTWDSWKGKKTITMALTGFAISTLAWFIVEFIFTNLD